VLTLSWSTCNKANFWLQNGIQLNTLIFSKCLLYYFAFFIGLDVYYWLKSILAKPITPEIQIIRKEFKISHNKDHIGLYRSPSIVMVVKSCRVRWAVYVIRIQDTREAHRILVGKSLGKRPFGRLWRRRENNIKMDLGKIQCKDGRWIEQTQVCVNPFSLPLKQCIIYK
jgi:hypothetical protein